MLKELNKELRKELTEETFIFLSVLKWIFLATVMGSIIGFATGLFLKILHFSVDFTGRYPYYFFLLPAGLVLSVVITKYLAPDAGGHGTEKVIRAVHKNSGRIKWIVVPVKLVTTVITLATGGSVGKEGPAAQIGAGLSSMFSDLLKLNDYDRKKLVICGISAGFAAVFGTPVAGAIFGIEVLIVGAILYDVLLPSFIAGITSYQIAKLINIEHFNYIIHFPSSPGGVFFLKIVLSGLFFGLCSVLMVDILYACDYISRNIKLKPPLKAFVGGLILVGLAFVFSGRYFGLGLDTIHEALQGKEILWYAFIAKMVFTGITLSFGGSGGIITPIFFVGAAAGSIFANVMNLDMAAFSAIGLVSLIAGCTNTPIASSIMAIELFGPEIAPYAAIACVISFLMSGHRSVYPYQRLAFAKSHAIEIEEGHEVEGATIHFKPGRGFLRTLVRLLRVVRRILKNMKETEEFLLEKVKDGVNGLEKEDGREEFSAIKKEDNEEKNSLSK